MDKPLIRIEVLEGLIIVRASAERLGEEQLRVVETHIRSTAGARGGVPMVLDLSGVAFISSLSLASLIRTASELRERRQRLALAGLNPNVREIILKAKLDRLFEMHEDVDAAVRAVTGA